MKFLLRSVAFIVAAGTLFYVSGCSQKDSVPTAEEAKSAIESYVIGPANLSRTVMFSPVKVSGIKSFEILEAHGDNEDLAELADEIDTKIDLRFLEGTKELMDGRVAIVKASFDFCFVNKQSGKTVQPDTDINQTRWYYMKKAETGKWSVFLPISNNS